LSFSLYSGFFTNLPPDSIRYLSWPIFLMATVVVFYGGQKIHQKGWAAWRSMGFGMETLISTGALFAYFFSLYHFFENSIHLYFDTASMLITLVLLGKLLESRTKEKVSKDLESFFSLVPTKVRIPTPAFPDGRYVSVEHLRPGVCFVFEENEIAPADGLIIDGEGTIDESGLTGEALPKTKKAGDRINSGTRLASGKMTVKAEAVGENSILGQMVRIMEKALGQKTPLEGKTDIVLRWFVPLILALALATMPAGWLLGLSFEQAVIRGITVMVISCPCALGIAIPLARVAGISLAAEKGILVRDFSAFESALRIDTFVFDKTGTLTTGNWRLLKVESIDPWTSENVMAIAAALERDSKHHVGMIIRKYARQKNIFHVQISEVKFHENGVSGSFENKKVKIGAASFCGLKPHESFEPGVLKNGDELKQTLYSSVYLTLNDILIGRILFGDRLKKGAAETIDKLQKAKYQTCLISGDSTKITRKLAQNLGIQTNFGEMLPLQKAGFIEQLKENGKIVAMAGDGINDAAALAESDLAMAVNSGSFLGKEAAHLTLMKGEPLQIVDFLSLAQRVNGKITQNLIFSFLYNMIAIPVAMAGFLSPPVAVCTMLLSSLSVTGNTLLLIKAK
ncbi:MAG: cation-translocating P-type ATPase, partial [Desulfobacterales bacterium]